MANAWRSTADVVTMNSDLGFIISDVLDGAPLVAQMAARTAMKNTITYSKRTVNPVTAFRAENDGLENTDSTTVAVTTTLKILDASFSVDVAVADAREDGWASEVFDEGQAHLRQAMAEVESQIFYSTGTGGQSAGFVGLNTLTNLDDIADAQTVNAGGTTATTASSVYAMRFGERDVELVWGQRGQLAMGDMSVVPVAGATGTFPAYYTPITGLVGLKIGGVSSVVRIVNVTADSTKTLTDDLLAEAIVTMDGGAPDAFVMGKRSLQQLRASRTATNPTGAPAPFPVEAYGVPIIVSPQILETEALAT